MTVAAVLTAAGSGSRLGAAMPKALVLVAGRPLVVHAARGLAASGVVDLVVVPVPRGHEGEFARELTAAADLLDGVPVRLVVGGASRQASVAAALASLPPEVDVVLVHDAARALAPADLVRRVVEAVRGGARVVVPAVPVTDSVLHVDGDDVRPVDRAALRAVQTPQGFDRAVLDAGHAAGAHRADDEATAATDDASLCTVLGERITLVAGSPDAFKITVPADLGAAAALLAAAEAASATGARAATEGAAPGDGAATAADAGTTVAADAGVAAPATRPDAGGAS